MPVPEIWCPICNTTFPDIIVAREHIITCGMEAEVECS